MNTVVLVILGLQILTLVHTSPISPIEPTVEPKDEKDPSASASPSAKKTNFKRFEVRQRADDHVEYTTTASTLKPEHIDSALVAVDTGAKVTKEPAVETTNKINVVEKAVKDYQKPSGSGALMRAREAPTHTSLIKPEVVRFRSGQPSLKVEVKSDFIVSAIETFLKSKVFRRYADEMAQKAFVVLKVIKDELRKPDNDKEEAQKNEEAQPNSQ